MELDGQAPTSPSDSVGERVSSEPRVDIPLPLPASLPSPPTAAAAQSSRNRARRVFSSRDTYGNLSLYFLFVSYLSYWIWRSAFEYPASTRAVLWGFWSIKVSTWSALIDTLGGWLSLSVLISLTEPGHLLRNLHHPLSAIEEKIRWVFRSFAVMALSAVILFLTLGLVCSNVSIDLASDHELLVCLPLGHGSALLMQDGVVQDLARLGGGRNARLLLRGPLAREVLLLRDRYNLVTIEALELQRSLVSFRYRGLALEINGKKLPFDARR